MKNTIQIALLCAVIVVSGCQRKSVVIARIGAETITIDEFMEQLTQAPEEYADFLSTSVGRSRFVDVLVKEKLMIAAAKDLRLDRSKEYRAQVDEYVEGFKQQLADYKSDLLVQEYYQRLKATKLLVTPEEVQAYYKSNEQRFRAPVTVTLKYIFAPDRSIIEQARTKILQGASFQAVAQEIHGSRAADETANTLTYTQPGSLAPEIETAAQAIATGALSEIVAADGGYYIFRKTAQVQAPAIGFEDAKPLIEQVLEKQKFDAYVVELKRTYQVKVSSDVVERSVNTYMIRQLKNNN